ncbi:MAG TPA: DUF2723 domain-containing protein, partial [Anaerolineae bacterium]|nr:DUF2723 domain-containing protein [Anaerolineae bacterium]
MTSHPALQTIKNSLPLLTLSLFITRLLNEQIHLSLPLFLIIILLPTLALFYRLRHKYPTQQLSPLLFLAIYLFYPTPSLPVALFIAIITFLTYTQINFAPFPTLTINNHSLTIPPPPTTAALLLTLIISPLYLFTLIPGPLPADNGEFQLIAAQLGVAHPPGFPLYTIIAHLYTQLLPSDPATSVTLFATSSSLLTLYFLYLTTYHLTKKHLPASAATLALATSTTFWAQATTANIRSLTTLFAILTLYTLVRFHQAIHNNDQAARDRWLFRATLAIGLGITHHPSLIFMGLSWGAFVLYQYPTFLRPGRHWRLPLLAVALSLLPLLYLPWRALAGAPGAPATLLTWTGFWDHVLARGFSGDFFYFRQPDILWLRLKVMANVFTFQLHPFILLTILASLPLFLRRAHRDLILLIPLPLATHTLITAMYRAPQTVEYMLPAYLPALLIMTLGLTFLLNHSPPKNIIPLGLTLLITLTPLNQLRLNYPSYAALAQYPHTVAHLQPIFDHAPADALVLAHWHWISPLQYQQTIDGQRPDLDLQYVFPTAEPYHQTWARRVQEALTAGRAVITTQNHPDNINLLPPPQPIGHHFLYTPQPTTTLPDHYTPTTINFPSALTIHGYHLTPETDTHPLDTPVHLTIAWSTQQHITSTLHLVANLIAIDGALYAQQDISVPIMVDGLNFTRFTITPRPGLPLGTSNLNLSAYTTQPLLTSDGQPHTTLTTLTFTGANWPPPTQNPRNAVVTANGRRLIGYDWDNTLPDSRRLYLHWYQNNQYHTEVRTLPPVPAANPGPLPTILGAWGFSRPLTINDDLTSHYIPLSSQLVWHGTSPLPNNPTPGQTITPAPQFTARQPLTQDIIISLRLVGYEADNFHWAWTDLNDTVPALGAIPTLKWIAGSTITSPQPLTISPQATPNQTIQPILTLYDA